MDRDKTNMAGARAYKHGVYRGGCHNTRPTAVAADDR